jgi:hypothetical protein
MIAPINGFLPLSTKPFMKWCLAWLKRLRLLGMTKLVPSCPPNALKQLKQSITS